MRAASTAGSMPSTSPIPTRDHSFGLVPLIGRFLIERRERPLPVIGHSGVASFVRGALDLGYPGMRDHLPFPLEFVAVSPARRLDFGALSLSSARSDHGVLNLSVRFEAEGSSCAFSGDGAPSAATEALYRGVDVLFHELYSVRRKLPGHSTLAELRALAARAEVPRVVVSHHARKYKARLHRAVAGLREPGRDVDDRPPRPSHPNLTQFPSAAGVPPSPCGPFHRVVSLLRPDSLFFGGSFANRPSGPGCASPGSVGSGFTAAPNRAMLAVGKSSVEGGRRCELERSFRRPRSGPIRPRSGTTSRRWKGSGSTT